MPDYAHLFFLGMAYGLMVCSFSCLPFYGPYLMATGNGFKDGLISSVAFGIGKLAVYSTLAGVAALLGSTLALSHGHRVVIGFLLIVVTLTVPYMRKNGCTGAWCTSGKRFSIFTLGILSSLIPCPPLAAVLILAAGSGDMLSGILYGFSYGSGLLVSPMLLLGGGLALISQKIRQEICGVAAWMEKLAMTIMVILAVKIML
jgi:cytochrome c-type biogenesis protein